MSKLKDLRQQARIARGILDKRVYTGPWTVQIDLTNACNNNCIGCWCRSPLMGDREMSEDDKKKFLPYDLVIGLIDDLDDMGVREIYFTGGGEPFMHPNIIEIMRYVKEKDMRVDMSTNFTLVNEKIAEKLVDIGIDNMNLSLWAGTPETYSAVHPNKTEKTFPEIERRLNYIHELKKSRKKEKPTLGMYNVIFNTNYHEVDKMVEFAFKTRLVAIDFTPIDTIPGKTDVLKLNEKQRKELITKFESLRKLFPKFEKKYEHTLEFRNYDQFLRRIKNENALEANYDTNIIDTIPCYAGWTFARVLAGGDVDSCLKSFRIPIGNIHKKSFKEIWFNEKQQLFREKTLNCKRDDPYFRNIGNDLSGEGCYKCCDNLGSNLWVHSKLSGLKFYHKKLLGVTRYI